MLQNSEKIIRHKVGLLNLAEELGNVSKACQIMGLSRDTFYRYRSAVEDGGVEALLERPRRSPNLKNRIDLETEDSVTDYAIEYPAHGQVRVFDRVCTEHDIDHRLTKIKHPWTNGQVERMNRTTKDATVKRYHYNNHEQLKQHLDDFINAYNYGRRLKTLKGLTPYEFICKCWTNESPIARKRHTKQRFLAIPVTLNQIKVEAHQLCQSFSQGTK
jgi:hypothetical protein